MPYHNLSVYQKAYQLALELHVESIKWPRIEQCEIGSQLRRASKSICANIAEGMGKQASEKEVRRFVQIAIGSCDECRVWLDFARDLGYIDQESHRGYDERYCEVGRMLRGIQRRYS